MLLEFTTICIGGQIFTVDVPLDLNGTEGSMTQQTHRPLQYEIVVI